MGTSRSRLGLWTARAMQGPTRPQSLYLFQPSRLIPQLTFYRGPLVTFSDVAIRGVNFARRLTSGIAKPSTLESLARIMHDDEKLRDGCGKKRAIHVANRCPNKLHRVSALRHSRHDRRYAASLRRFICPAQETHN